MTVVGRGHVMECDSIHNGDARDSVDAVGHDHVGNCVCVESTAWG